MNYKLHQILFLIMTIYCNNLIPGNPQEIAHALELFNAVFNNSK